MRPRPFNVRFPGEGGHCDSEARCPLMTQADKAVMCHRVKLTMVESVTPLIVTDPSTSTIISGTNGRTNRSTKTRVPLGTIVHRNDAGLGTGEGGWTERPSGTGRRCLRKHARC